MSHRTDLFSDQSLSNLYGNHPYLLIFQKDDWKEHLHILSQIYHFLEQENTRTPYEVLKSLIFNYYANSGVTTLLEEKTSRFFRMCLEDLCVLKDSHDQYGQRFFETTKYGKELLLLVESLLNQKAKFSGTGAETLLGALNNILTSREQMSSEEALAHHRQMIKKYQNDMARIEKMGVTHAEMLPMPHSNEALFRQAEEAAIHILSSIEDVKTAIEMQRKLLAESYLGITHSAGRNISAVAEFYQKLYDSPEYVSYNQAKMLLSFLEAYSIRFPEKNIDRLLNKISSKELVSKDDVQRSYLKKFMRQFSDADEVIREKTKEQVRILQMQVNYAMNNDVVGVKKHLDHIFSMLMTNKESAAQALTDVELQIDLMDEFQLGEIELSELRKNIEFESLPLVKTEFEADEYMQMMQALLHAEEATIETITEHFRLWYFQKDENFQNNNKGNDISKNQPRCLSQYEFKYGLSEYYVISQIELFAPEFSRKETHDMDLFVATKYGDLVLCDIKDVEYFYVEPQ